MARMIRSKKENSILEDGKRNVLQVIFSRTMLIMLLIVVQFAYIIARMYAFVEYIPVLLGSEFLLVAIMMVVILNSKENPMIKLSWCVLVGVLPIFGSVVYLVVRQDLGYRLQQKRIAHVEAESRKNMDMQSEVLERLKESDKQTYHTANYLKKYAGSMISTNTKVKYLPIGEQMFEEMVCQLKQAESYIFLEYFMIAPGKMWNTILEILVEKAKAGVDVRLLYDGSCAVYLLPYKYPNELEKLGIKCRMFSPPVPFISTHYNNRDHRKIMVIDGRVAFTGGVNLCDEYINVNSPCGHWKDIGISLEGDAIHEFTCMFMKMWVATEKKPIAEMSFPDMEQYRYQIHSIEEGNKEGNKEKDKESNKEGNKESNACSQLDAEKLEIKISNSKVPLSVNGVEVSSGRLKEETDCGYVIPYGDSPVDDENVGEMVYLDILNQAKDYVYIMTPYLILDHEMLTAITFAAKRGVDVRIILPHIPDKKTAFALAQANYNDLLAAGVHVYEYTPGFVHAKMFISDDERAVVGTVNLDYRSLYWHYECSAYMYQVPAISSMKEDYLKTQELCEQVSQESITKIGGLSKFASRILKLVAPLM